MINNANAKRLLNQYLSEESERHGGLQRWSCMTAGLRDARRTTGRDEKDWTSKPRKRAESWLGLMGYIAVLDQLGTAVLRSALTTDKQTRLDERLHDGKPVKNFERCLVQFTDLQDDDIYALYALRCSLMHDFSLVNLHNNRKYQRVFRLDPNAQLLVKQPETPWDGTFPASADNMTVVNPVLVGELVEGIAIEVRKCQANDHLELALKSEKEFEARYFLQF